MQINADFILIGTGAAPLIAAHHLISDGKSVALVNPDRDYFLEDSEIGFDPFGLSAAQILRSDAETTHSILSPFFPGPLELAAHSPTVLRQRGDHGQPWVRPRTRLWIRPAIDGTNRALAAEWDRIENFYLTAEEHGLHPQLVDGLSAMRRFPGFSPKSGLLDLPFDTHAIQLPVGSDMDVERFRLGLHEFVAERVGSDRILRGVSSIQLSPMGEMDCHLMAGGGPCKIIGESGILVFWTSGISNLVRRILPERPASHSIEMPESQSWEDWQFVSRDALIPEVIGWHEGGFVLAQVDGAPGDHHALLRLLCPGNGEFKVDRLNRLFRQFLRWRSFALRNLKTRTHLIWNPEAPTTVWSNGKIRVLGRADGSMVEIAYHVKSACDQLLNAGIAS